MTENKIYNQEHYNIPQIKFALAFAQTNMLVWARRTGKTVGALDLFYLLNAHKMPRSNGFIIASTYEQMLSRTLPPLVSGWTKRGFKENVHFWIQKFPDKKLNLPKPFLVPRKPDYSIFWYNGSHQFLVSQDVTASINGVATQYGGGDEARYLDVEKLREEAMLTFSGGEQYRDLYNYTSTCFTTDMPMDRSGDWILQHEELMDEQVINHIMKLQENYNHILLDCMTKQYAPSTMNDKMQLLTRLDVNLNELRKGTVYYSEASTFENIHVLGMEPIRHFFRTLDEAEIHRSVLNKKRRGSPRGFYACLSEAKHGYDAPNYGYINTLTDAQLRGTKDCRWNYDLIHNKPIDISIDMNASIKCVVVDQMNEHLNEYRRLSSHFVLHPLQLEHLADDFDEYYRHFYLRRARFIYDKTMDWEVASTGKSYAQEWAELLEKRGWNVERIYIGETPSHTARYKLWNKILLHLDKRFPKFKFNRVNAKQWFISASEAGSLDRGNKIEKDKRPEKDESFPQEEAPHLSDAGDTTFWYNMTILEYKELVFVDIL